IDGVTTLKLKEEWFVLKSSDRHRWPNNKFVDFLSKYIVKGAEVFIGGIPSFSTYLSRAGEIVTSQWIYVDTIELLPTDVFNEDIIKCADEIACRDNNHTTFIDSKINIQNENHNFLD
ncbi:MAG: hypothetical protein K2P99_02495, partial [Burkholderiales bacterium]|nr:hypothetical protein [Burkholderiales bacterium]